MSGKVRFSIWERMEPKFIPEPMSGCWLWLACKNIQGYGKIGVGQKVELAHRVSWTIHRGPLAPEQLVLHKCDTPACINPDHLFLGTQADNMADASRKGRTKIGVRTRRRDGLTGNSKITLAQVAYIRDITQQRKFGQQAILARQFGMSQTAISEVVLGRTWTSV